MVLKYLVTLAVLCALNLGVDALNVGDSSGEAALIKQDAMSRGLKFADPVPYTGSDAMFTALYHSEFAYCIPQSQASFDFDQIKYTATFEMTKRITNTSNSLEGYIGYQSNTGEILVSFRGTSNFKNWVTDLNAIKTTYPLCSGCMAHKGFFTAEQEIIGEVNDEVNRLKSQHSSDKVLVVGHSLGAALATLTALDLANRGSYKITLWNFGSPRIFNQAGADWASSSASGIVIGGRRTHYKDIVTHVPPHSAGFRHISGEIYENGPISSYPSFPGGPMVQCDGKEDPNCADQYDGMSIDDHCDYNGITMGGSGCSSFQSN
jgi:hypothetical protein